MRESDQFLGRTLYGDLLYARYLIGVIGLAILSVIYWTVVWIARKPALDAYNEHQFTRIVFVENAETTIRDPKTNFVTDTIYDRSQPMLFDTQPDAMAWLVKNSYSGGLVEPSAWKINAGLSDYNKSDDDLNSGIGRNFLDNFATRKEEREGDISGTGRPRVHKQYTVEFYILYQVDNTYYIDHEPIAGTRMICEIDKCTQLPRSFIDYMIDPAKNPYHGELAVEP